MPHLKKAELVEGVVYLPSPVHLDQLGSPQAALVGWLWNYWAFTPGVRVGDNSTVRLDLDNEPQPDALMIREPSHGGRVVIGPRGYVEALRSWSEKSRPQAPASTCTPSCGSTVATRSRSTSSGASRTRRWTGSSCVREIYACLPLTAAGVYRSEVFRGLWLDPVALRAPICGRCSASCSKAWRARNTQPMSPRGNRLSLRRRGSPRGIHNKAHGRRRISLGDPGGIKTPPFPAQPTRALNSRVCRLAGAHAVGLSAKSRIGRRQGTPCS